LLLYFKLKNSNLYKHFTKTLIKILKAILSSRFGVSVSVLPELTTKLFKPKV